jgi:hypothetical protein
MMNQAFCLNCTITNGDSRQFAICEHTLHHYFVHDHPLSGWDDPFLGWATVQYERGAYKDKTLLCVKPNRYYYPLPLNWMMI